MALLLLVNVIQVRLGALGAGSGLAALTTPVIGIRGHSDPVGQRTWLAVGDVGVVGLDAIDNFCQQDKGGCWVVAPVAIADVEVFPAWKTGKEPKEEDRLPSSRTTAP